MATENVTVRSSPLFESVLQGAGDVLLSNDLGELLRTVFSRQNGVTHGTEQSIIRDRAGLHRRIDGWDRGQVSACRHEQRTVELRSTGQPRAAVPT